MILTPIISLFCIRSSSRQKKKTLENKKYLFIDYYKWVLQNTRRKIQAVQYSPGRVDLLPLCRRFVQIQHLAWVGPRGPRASSTKTKCRIVHKTDIVPSAGLRCIGDGKECRCRSVCMRSLRGREIVAFCIGRNFVHSRFAFYQFLSRWSKR